jgi:hypothetical protein
LEILAEKQFVGVSQFVSLSPHEFMLAYHNSSGAWIYRWNHAVEPFSIEEYGLVLPHNVVITNPAWSPDGNHIVWAISGISDGKYQTSLVLFDLTSKATQWMHQYQSLEDYQLQQWLRPWSQWSPDGQWIAFQPGDAAFADDSGVWVFSVDGTKKHQIKTQYMIGWSWDSQYLCHGLKDYKGCVKVPSWHEYRLTPLPFTSSLSERRLPSELDLR